MPAATAAFRHPTCRRAAEAGVTAEVRTSAPTAISAVNILDLVIRASQLRVISMRARSGLGLKSLLCDWSGPGLARRGPCQHRDGLTIRPCYCTVFSRKRYKNCLKHWKEK